MKNKVSKIAGLFLGSIAVASISSCDVDQTKEGKMPSVDVDAEGGKMPKVEVTEKGKLPSVDVDAEGGQLPEFEVKGPDVEVGSRKVEVEVPTIDVDLPDDDDEEVE